METTRDESSSATSLMTAKSILPLVLLSLLACRAVATEAPAWRERIPRAAEAEMETSGAPSLQIAVGVGDGMLFEGAYGLADVENRVPATPETRYRTASVSKWMTATAAMRLAEQERLDLDAPIQTYCPAYPEKRRPITTRQLLTHTAGIRHYADYDDERAAAGNDRERAEVERRRLRDELSTFTRYTDVIAPLDTFRNDPLVFEPGTDWRYTSFGYRLLGCVLQGAAGRDYRTLMVEDVFTPVGMTRTSPDDAWSIVPKRASGYRRVYGEPLRRAELRDVSENLPAGGHLSTAADLVRFAQAFAAGRLVSAETVSLMTRRPLAADAATEDYDSWRHAIPTAGRYAYGVMFFPHETERWFGHTGQQAGASSIVVHVPESDLTIAVLTNVKGWDGYLRFVRQLRAIVGASIQANLEGVPGQRPRAVRNGLSSNATSD